MNVEKLLEVKRTILRDPGSQFVMASYFTTADTQYSHKIEIKRRKIAKCGTAACIAGTAIALELANGDRREGRRKLIDLGLNAFTEGARILDLTREQAERLFYLQYQFVADLLNPEREWPASFRAEYLAAKTLKERKRIAARRIDHFIKTGGAE